MDQRRETLCGLLEQHVPACEVESAYKARMVDLLNVLGDPMSRDHYEPGHFTASGFVISPDGQSVLLVLHRKLERWLQPGGHVDPGDTDLFAAACREVGEETGVMATAPDETLAKLPGMLPGKLPGVFDVDIHPIPSRKSEPAHAHFDVRFLMRTATTKITRNDETHDAAWVPMDELSRRMTDPCEARVIRKLQDL